jgi:hypothetical protein
MGKLSVKAFMMEGTEEAMVLVFLTVIACYKDVEDKRN